MHVKCMNARSEEVDAISGSLPDGRTSVQMRLSVQSA
jgi:hypothetical protein